ncbi:thioredoxin family protein [Lutibacter sp.]|uniref:thioredoxin family protein n=1 Tax=Lutibacter sp. TaxID=1925666 RepID=UPI0025C083C6|nr:thioredoxin family protein [Lutibacter sp.]MCF6181303.1 thioredoxin family protein [Lutibacter sp.]
MKKLILAIIILTSIGCNAQKKLTPTKDSEGNLIGYAQKSDFLKEAYNYWFTPNYKNYKVDEKLVAKIKPLLKNVTIKAFMGTWCSDSKEQTPALYKILDATDFNYKNLKLIAVDRDKKTPDSLQKGYNIHHVPTFIFYKNGKEIGRFVEYPQETIEKDMIKILSGKSFTPNYSEDN